MATVESGLSSKPKPVPASEGKAKDGGTQSWWDRFRAFVKREHLALAMLHPSVFMSSWVLYQPASWKAGSIPGELERMEKYFKTLGRKELFKGFALRDFDGNSYAYKFAAYPSVRFSHSLMALPWSMLLPIQLSVGIRKNFPALHRFGGRSFVFSSVAMLFGYMQIERHRLFYSLDKNKQLPLFIITCLRTMAVWFAYTLARAVLAIRNRKVKEHEIWMLRHIASGIWVIFGRSTFMPLLILTKQFLGIGDVSAVESQKMHFDYGHVMSIIFCVGTCEWYIRKYKTPQQKKKKKKQHLNGEVV